MRSPDQHDMSWVKKLGVAAFLFFLIKGLLWLIIPAAIFVWSC